MENILIILHGWNSKISRWKDLKKNLNKNFKVYLPVLPGFGQNKLTYPFNLDDYVLWFKKYLQKIKAKNPVIVAHSFGARIAIEFLSQKKVKKLILINAAGLKPKLNLKRFLGFFIAKLGNFLLSIPPFFIFKNKARFLLYFLLKEKDYYQADEVLKKTMKNIIKIDLKKKLRKIKTPTLILWGAKDKITPVADAWLMKEKIPNAKLIIFKDASHALPFQKSKQVADLIYKFCRQ